MTRESTGEVVFVASSLRSILFTLLAVLMTAVFAGVVFNFLPGVGKPPLYVYAMSGLGMVVSAVATLDLLRRAITLRGVVVSVGPHGILDRRISEALIPWSAVRGVSTLSRHPQKYLKIHLDPPFEAALAKSSIFYRIWRAFAPLFGVGGGPMISIVELSGSFGDLESAATKFWERSKQREGIRV